MTKHSDDITTRLRDCATDLTFSGRPDPHDDRAMLHEAAGEIERLRGQVAAYQNHHHELGQYLIVAHKPGEVDIAAVAILDGYHVGAKEVAGGGAGEPGETTLGAALRLLKLAAERGAYAFRPARSAETTREDRLADAALELRRIGLLRDCDSEAQLHLACQFGVVHGLTVDEFLPLIKGWNVLREKPSPEELLERWVVQTHAAWARRSKRPLLEEDDTLNARKLVAQLEQGFDAIAYAATAEDGEIDLVPLREAVEGLAQLTRGMGAGDDGPVMAIGVAEALAEDARSAARNLDSYLARTEVGEDVSTIGEAVTMLRVLADLADPQGEDGFTEPTEPAQPGVAAFDADPVSAQVEFFRDLQDRGADKGPVSDAPEQDPAARKMV
jgi:hypothetical protein